MLFYLENLISICIKTKIRIEWYKSVFEKILLKTLFTVKTRYIFFIIYKIMLFFKIQKREKNQKFLLKK